MATGKRAGSRRGPRRAPKPRGKPLGYAAGITLAVVAWGYLVYLAIDFGTAARGGQGSGWALLGLAAVGAMACLFVGLILGARLLTELGITQPPGPTAATAEPSAAEPTASSTPDTAEPPAVPAPRPPGGRRRR